LIFDSELHQNAMKYRLLEEKDSENTQKKISGQLEPLLVTVMEPLQVKMGKGLKVNSFF
jgi:hypothetical protein